MRPTSAIMAFLAYHVIAAASFAQDSKLATNKYPVPRVRKVKISAVATEEVSQLPMIRVLPQGRVLLSDAMEARLVLFDSTLLSPRVVADGNGASGVPFPGAGGLFPLIPYHGDSTLMTDWQSRSFYVVDPNGKLVKAIASPRSSDLMNSGFDHHGHPSTDSKGNIYYRAQATNRAVAEAKLRKSGASQDKITARDSSQLDTVSIIRANFESRNVDTIAQYAFSTPRDSRQFQDKDGKSHSILFVSPFALGSDDWTVLPDGTVVIARAHDFHFDFVSPDLQVRPGPKLPFYGHRLTDADKLARIDSMRSVIDSIDQTSRPYRRAVVHRKTPDGVVHLDTIMADVQFDALDRIPDYLPAFRDNSLQVDLSGNIWILPTTTSKSIVGTLYDVIDRNGKLTAQVHFPINAVVLGFADADVVYFATPGKQPFYWQIGRGHIQP